jgi:quercetin dioxygenase-like cupin family protein
VSGASSSIRRHHGGASVERSRNAPRITPGTTLENPVTGERFTFTETAATTDGELLAFDFALREGGKVPIPHVHPIQTERFAVVAGAVRFRLGLRTLIAEPGDVIEVPPGVTHSFANAGPGEARMRIEIRPALAMAEMFAEVIALAHAGRMNNHGLPRNLFTLARLARRYDREAHAPLLSVSVQRALLAPLLWIDPARRGERGGTAALVRRDGPAVRRPASVGGER